MRLLSPIDFTSIKTIESGIHYQPLTSHAIVMPTRIDAKYKENDIYVDVYKKLVH